MELQQADQYKTQLHPVLNPSTQTTTYSDSVIKPIKIASFPDIHLGHHRTVSENIVSALLEIFRDEGELATWDLLVFPGDFFDRCLLLTDPYINRILYLIGYIFKQCAKHGIVIRWLEGTPGHDRKQTDVIHGVYKVMANLSDQFKVDFAHVTELSVEYIESLGISMLYVPDEWNIDVMQTYDEAVNLIRQRGWDRVDYCLLHGAFNYQINEKLNPKSHNEELWCNLVNYYIFSGHVHFRSQYKKILNAGSFDRLAHGEEADKGWLTLEITKAGEHLIKFHTNHMAIVYVTVDVRGLTSEEVFSLLEDRYKDVPRQSHIRLWVNPDDEIKEGIKTLRARYSYYHFTFKVEKKEAKPKSIKAIEERKQTIDITRDNVRRIVEERLVSLPGVNVSDTMRIFGKYLSEVK
nr:MAG TPA: DNA double-strand break repair protein [Caudoviricetes sp.]